MKLKYTLEEAKFAVEVEDIGTIIVDGTSEGEVKSRIANKLKDYLCIVIMPVRIKRINYEIKIK